MKKKIVLFCLVAIILFGFASSVFALDWPSSPGPGGIKLCPTVPAKGCPGPDPSTLAEMIEYFYRWAIVLGGLAAFVVLLYAGFQYLTSAGDPGKTKDARDRITSAIGGLALLLASFIILNIVNPELTGLSALSRDELKGIFDFTMGREFRKVEIPSCQKVIVYAKADFQKDSKIGDDLRAGAPLKRFPSPKRLGNINETGEGSLEIIGNCTALLYPTSDGTGDAATFSFNVPNLSVLNPDGFGSLRVISNKGTQAVQPATSIITTEGGKTVTSKVLFTVNGETFVVAASTDSLKFEWDAAGLNDCKASGASQWTGSKSQKGFENIILPQNNTYPLLLTCIHESSKEKIGGVVTVVISSTPVAPGTTPPTVTFTAINPNTGEVSDKPFSLSRAARKTVPFEWSSTFATYCEKKGDLEDLIAVSGTTGRVGVTIDRKTDLRPHTYTIKCTHETTKLWAEKSIIITVKP